MNSDYHPHDPSEWTALHFGGLDLKDVRRNKRAKKIAQSFAEQPEVSIPQAFTRAYDVKAAYAFFEMETSTPENLQATHKRVVKETLERQGTYLLIEDGSEFNWKNQSKRAGLGVMHKGYQGFVLQSVLAVKWHGVKAGSKRQAVEIIGLAHQEYYARVPRPESESNTDSKSRQQRARESQLWERSGESLVQKSANEYHLPSEASTIKVL
jgi:beta-glucosidase-like glycosyl hydrolase